MQPKLSLEMFGLSKKSLDRAKAILTDLQSETETERLKMLGRPLVDSVSVEGHPDSLAPTKRMGDAYKGRGEA